MTALYLILAALVLDELLGEPKQLHPLVLFGALAEKLERLSGGAVFRWISPVHRGILCWAVLVVPPAVILWLFLDWLPGYWQPFAECLVLYFTLGWKSMRQHAMQVYRHLERRDTVSARNSVSRIVSRETDKLDECGIAKGAVEAVVENGTDCALSPIFWFLILGAPGALMFRLVNTLDAMWGNRTERYIEFGRASAKIDDAMNFIPARFTAVAYALSGKFAQSIHCIKNQKAVSEGPNAGLVMAAGGGALGIELGGPVTYDGNIDHRPVLGTGREVESRDIIRSIRLVWRSMGIWGLAIAAILLALNSKDLYFSL